MAPPSGQPVVLVTGCSAGGIGYSLCEEFAHRGCRVFASARRREAAWGLEQAPGVVELLQLDVTDAGSIKAAVAAVLQRAGCLDILVNNAGVVVLGPTAEVPLATVRAAFEANVFGLLALTQAVVPIMAASGSGKIINVGSLTGYHPVPLRGIYSATKGAVMRLTDALRLELAPLGISVMLAAPGFINTHARDTAKDLAQTYSQHSSSGQSLWTGWMDVLDAAMRKLLRRAVPADRFARDFVDTALRQRLPRHYVGPCAGLEWLVRFLPLWLQDRLTYRSMGLPALEPVLRQNAAALPRPQAVR